MSTDDVLSAIESLKPGKTDSDRVSSYHLEIWNPLLPSLRLSFTMVICPSIFVIVW